MKKVSALIALALLAVAGTGFAVTCSYDNVPAATLLVPYFKVSSNGYSDFTQDVSPGNGTDTIIAITNVSSTGLIAHFTVWNKYSAPVVDFNVPLSGFDVAFASLSSIISGHLDINAWLQDPAVYHGTDVCFSTPGFGKTKYVRFPNPNATDAQFAGSKYNNPAFGAGTRKLILDSLDESGDINQFGSVGANVLDSDNNACGSDVDGAISGDFSGYVTIDVVNYCTNYFPVDPSYYRYDAIATTGWQENGNYTPNALMGDVFYVDKTAGAAGNISGDIMVATEFDSRLDWTIGRTFYNRYFTDLDTGVPQGNPLYDASYAFIGDGREPLGTGAIGAPGLNRYGFRYLNTPDLRSWITVWRSDVYDDGTSVDLCAWWAGGGGFGGGLYDADHTLIVSTFDNDEGQFTPGNKPGCPSPPRPEDGCGTSGLWVFLESQRIDLLGNLEINPGGFTGGWLDVTFPGTNAFNQTWVGVQHSSEGLLLSVGHGATLLNNQFLCDPNIFGAPGNVIQSPNAD